MRIISEFLISLFESLSLYSSQNGLGDHLRGLDMECTDFTGQSIYNIVFIILFLVNTIGVVNYYYWIFNRVPFNVCWKWFLNTLVSALIVSLIAFVYSHDDLKESNFCPDLAFGVDDCVGFALATFIFSWVWCCVLSFIIKWKSSVNKKVPF